MCPKLWSKLLREASQHFSDIHLRLCVSDRDRAACVLPDLDFHQDENACRRARSYLRDVYYRESRGAIQLRGRNSSRATLDEPGRALQPRRHNSPYSRRQGSWSTEKSLTHGRNRADSDTMVRTIEEKRSESVETDSEPDLRQSLPAKVARAEAVINDPLLRDLSSQMYHLSSSESETEIQRPRRGPISAGRRHRSLEPSGAPLKTSTLLEAVGADSKDSPSKNGEPPQTDERPATPDSGRHERSMSESENASCQTIPFLLWRVTMGPEHGNGVRNSGTLSRLIGKVQLSLEASTRIGSHYKTAYSCSMETLCSRHETLRKSRPSRLATQFSASEIRGSEPNLADMSTAAGAGQDVETSPLMHQERSLQANALEQANRLIHNTFTLSKTVLGLFVPLFELPVHEEVGKVLDRYWGALDVSFRVSGHVSLGAKISELPPTLFRF